MRLQTNNRQRRPAFRALFLMLTLPAPAMAQPSPCPATLAATGCRKTELTAQAPGDGHVIAGELLLPAGKSTAPMVMLVSGTGRQSRDFEAFEGRYHPHRDLAHALLARGIGVLRFDERNTGGSTGDHKTARSADLKEDVRLIFRRAAEMPGVDRRRMYIFGHSEGAIFAMQLAAEEPLVAGIALAGAPFKSGRAMTWDQVQIETPRPAATNDADFHLLLRHKFDEEIAFQSTRPSLADLLDYDGRETAAKVRKPAIIFEGQQDWQVRPPQGRQLADAMRDAGNGQVVYHSLANMGHLMTPNPPGVTDYKALTDYAVDRRLTSGLARWILSQRRKRR